MSRIQSLGRITIGTALGLMLLALPQVQAQIGGIDEGDRRIDGTRTSRNVNPMNPPARARLQATTLDGDIDDLLGMVGQLGGLGCAFEVDDPAQNIICSDPDFDPCSAKQNVVGPNFYFVNGFDLTKGVVVYNAQTQEMYLGLRVVGYIGDVDGDLNPNTICPDASASGIIENFGIGSTDGYRWDFDIDCSPSGVFGRDAYVEIRGPTDAITGDPSIDITSNITYTTAEVSWAGNGGLDSTEIEVKLTGVDLLTNFPNGGFDVKVFAGSEEDCVGENKSDPGRCEPPVPALTATKTCVDVCAGDPTTCTIQVNNTGLVPIDVQVFDNIPTGHTYVSGSASGIAEPASAGGNDVLFTGPTLSPGGSFSFSFMVDTPVECFGEVTNFATATGTFTSGCYQDDPNFRTTEYDFDDTYVCLINTQANTIQDQTKCEGDNATFTVVAVGENLTYQWYKGGTQGNPGSGTLLQGETGSSLSLTNLDQTDESTYCVLVTGDCGTDWECASLTVDPPTVAEPFGDQTKCPGDDVTFTVSASGVNLSYQWYKGGSPGQSGSGTLIQGATSSSYTINGIQESDEATYCVLVTGTCGTDWECASLTVDPPTVAEPFADQTKCPGDDATFTVSASGLDLTYQWYKGGTQGNPGSGTLLQGETGSSLTLTGIVEGDESTYCVLVTGKCGTDWECASLTVDPPTVAQSFGDQTKCPGDDATFTVSASGLNLTYQWYKGGTQGNPQSGTLLQGETGSSLTLTGIVEGDEATYCVFVSGQCGTDWECAALTVDPPTVAEPFADQIKCPGENVTFTVSASGLNLTYQWYQGGTPGNPQSGTLLQGETGSSLTINGVTANDQATYCVYVSGQCGTAWECALLTVDPSTTSGPIDDQTKCPGESVTFSANNPQGKLLSGESAGIEILTFQWYKGGTQGNPQSGTLLQGETGPSLTINPVTENDEGTYCVYIVGRCGTDWECATLTVDPPTVAQSFGDQTKCPGDDATFTVSASGLNLTYQWYKGGTQGNPQSGTLLQGETGSSLTLTGIVEGDEATYCVFVSGQCGTDWECAALTVDPPTVAEPFADQIKCPGENVTFTVSASGLNLTYQWYQGGTPGNPQSGTLLQGETGSSLTINGVTANDQATYCVYVSGQCGTDWECALLTVDPSTTSGPIDDQTKCPGESVTFSANNPQGKLLSGESAGIEILTFQWYKGGTQGNPQSGTLLQGETGPSLTINPVTENDEGTYCVYIVGRCGTDWECATLTVDPPTEAEPFADQTKCPGDDATFTVSASGLNLTYQWYKGGTQGNPQSGTLLQGETGSSLTLTGIVEGDEATYCVFVSGQCGTDWECAALTVDPPTVAEPFADQIKCPGENVTFTVSASGLNLTYQWYQGGTPGNPQSGTLLQGETGSSLTINGVTANDQATYCVYVSGQCGTAWECALLTVDPSTTSGPIDDQTKCPGESVTFSANNPQGKLLSGESAGIEILTFQWYKGGTQGNPQSGTLLQGETGPSLTINPVTENDEGTYCVYIVGRCGTDWECATLTVDPPTEAGDIADQTTCVGDDVTFTVTASGQNLFYQWYKGGDPGTSQSGTLLETENGNSLTLTEVMESDEAVYCVYVSGDCGSVWKCATLTVDEVLVTVDNEVACRGEEVKLCPQVSGGTGPYAFSWTGPGSFTSPDSCITVGTAGDYTVTVTDRNQCQGGGTGTVTYLEAALEAYAVNESACVGETAALSIVIKNTSQGTQGFTLDCTIDGQTQQPILVNPIASGDSTVVPLEVDCVEGKTIQVLCTVTADLVDSPDCSAEVRVEGQVVCLVPLVEITKHDDLREECAITDSEVTYTIEVRNTGPVALSNIVVLDEVLAPLATYVGNSASGNPVSQPADGGTGTLRWEEAGPLAPNAKLTYTYRLVLGGGGECSGETAYENKASVEAYCGEAKTDDDTVETTCITCPTCWMTGGGFLNEGQKRGHKEDNFGGNVGPPPAGSWQHVQRIDNKITFNFHSHDVNAINCYHDGGDGPCSPATDNNVIEFGGTGKYSMGNGPRNKDAVWTARVEDHGEPGNNPHKNGCGSADYYMIEVRDPVTNAVVFTAEGFLDGGNFQLHKDTGKKLNNAVIGMNVTLNAFPNPISSSSGLIRFNVPARYAEERVEINLFDVSGRLVRKLVDEPRPAGVQSAHWDLRNDSGQQITAGIYFTRLRIASEERVIRLMVLSQR